MANSNSRTEYYCSINGHEHGPFSAKEIRQLAINGKLNGGDLVWKGGSTSKTAAKAIKGLVFSNSKHQQTLEPKPLGNEEADPHSSKPIVSKPDFSSSIKQHALEDPIREIGAKFKLICISVLFVLVPLLLAAIFLDEFGGPIWVVFGIGGQLLIIMFTVWIWWRVFQPRRPTEVLYLRSFSNDADSWKKRVAIQRELGDGIRLSGIRDPRKRRLGGLQALGPWFVAMKYCTPKFMDLVGYENWRAQVWNTTQTCKLVIIDLSVPTEFLLEEIEIVFESVGITRIAFLADAPQSEDSIKDIVRSRIPEVKWENGQIQSFIWPSGKDRESISKATGVAKEIAAIANNNDLQHDLVSPPEKLITAEKTRHWSTATKMLFVMIIAQVLVVAISLLVSIVGFQFGGQKAAQTTTAVFATIMLLLGSINWLVFVKEIGSFSKRVKATIAYSIFALPYLPFIFFSTSQEEDSRFPVSSQFVQEQVETDLAIKEAEDLIRKAKK